MPVGVAAYLQRHESAQKVGVEAAVMAVVVEPVAIIQAYVALVGASAVGGFVKKTERVRMVRRVLLARRPRRLRQQGAAAVEEVTAVAAAVKCVDRTRLDVFATCSADFGPLDFPHFHQLQSEVVGSVIKLGRHGLDDDQVPDLLPLIFRLFGRQAARC